MEKTRMVGYVCIICIYIQKKMYNMYMYVYATIYLYYLMSINNNVVLWISEDFSRHYFVMNKRLILYISDFKNFCYRNFRFFNTFSWTIINPTSPLLPRQPSPPNPLPTVGIPTQAGDPLQHAEQHLKISRWTWVDQSVHGGESPADVGLSVSNRSSVRWVGTLATNGPMLLAYPLTSFTF